MSSCHLPVTCLFRSAGAVGGSRQLHVTWQAAPRVTRSLTLALSRTHAGHRRVARQRIPGPQRCPVTNLLQHRPLRFVDGLCCDLLAGFVLVFFCFVLMFVYSEKEKEGERVHTCVQAAGGAERGRQSQAGPLLLAQSPTRGSNSQTVRSWPEPKSRVGRLTC